MTQERDETELSLDEAGILGMFRPETYSICLPRNRVRDRLEKMDLIEWVPPVWGQYNEFNITDKGRAAIAAWNKRAAS